VVTSSPPQPATVRTAPVPADVVTVAPPGAAAVAQAGGQVHSRQPLIDVDDAERAAMEQLRVDAESARRHTLQVERSIRELDASIAALIASARATNALPPAITDPVAKSAVDRALAAYNEAVARERRAAQLEAFGVNATQELEESQVAVRAAAEDLAAARRAVDASAAMAATQALQARTEENLVIAEQQRQRQDLMDELLQARLTQHDAEAALSSARARRLPDR
jgi:multidrug resistance efflux pump